MIACTDPPASEPTIAHRPVLRDSAARFVLVLTAGSTVLLLAAMMAYAGGSAARPATSGFDPLHNYFCDLIRPIAHNGADNHLGMWIGRASMLATAAAFAPFLLVLPRLYPRSTWGVVGRRAGVAAALALPGVAFTPSGEGDPSMVHAVAISLAGAPAFIAIAAAAAGMWSVRTKHPRLLQLTMTVLSVGTLNGGLWLATSVTEWPGRWALPTAQKVGWAALLAWLCAGAVAVARTNAMAAAADDSSSREPPPEVGGSR